MPDQKLEKKAVLDQVDLHEYISLSLHPDFWSNFSPVYFLMHLSSCNWCKLFSMGFLVVTEQQPWGYSKHNLRQINRKENYNLQIIKQGRQWMWVHSWSQRNQGRLEINLPTFWQSYHVIIHDKTLVHYCRIWCEIGSHIYYLFPLIGSLCLKKSQSLDMVIWESLTLEWLLIPPWWDWMDTWYHFHVN